MKRVGPDSRKSWMIAFVCCFIYMIMDGLQRMSGMLFVATIERFLVTRKQASLPYSLSFSIRFICGPLVGYLGQKFSVRSVAAIGCVLGSIGAGACFFAESIDTVTLLWGLLFGLGNGLANNLLPVSINQHFDKHRATASGISFSGSCLGSFVLAPIFEFLLNNYGLSGTFLLISGFILNCIPAALLLIKPNYDFKKSSKLLSTANGSKNPLGNMKIIENENTALNPYKENIQNKKSYCAEQMKQLSAETLLIKCTSHKNNLESLDLNQQFENCREKSQIDLNLLDSEIPSSSFGNADTDLTTENNETFEKVLLSPCEAYDKSIAYGTLKNFRTLSSEDLNSLKKNDFQGALPSYQNYSYQNSTHDFKQSYITYLSSDPANKNSVRRKDSQFADNTNIYLVSYIRNIDVGNNGSTMAFKYIPNCTNIPESKWPHRQNFKIRPNKRSLTLDKPILKSEKTSALKAFSVFFDPMFILIGITYAIYCFDFVCMFTVIVDFARDLNIGNSDEHYILMTMSAGGFVGRLGLGWITDGGFMTKTNFIALCFAVQGFVTVAIVWSNGFTTLMILSTLYGLSDSGIIIILPLMVAQYVDPDKQTVAMATRSIYAGPVCLAVAPLIGYFRDTLKSYNFLLYGVGVVMLLSCFSWFLVPYMERCKRNQ